METFVQRSLKQFDVTVVSIYETTLPRVVTKKLFLVIGCLILTELVGLFALIHVHSFAKRNISSGLHFELFRKFQNWVLHSRSCVVFQAVDRPAVSSPGNSISVRLTFVCMVQYVWLNSEPQNIQETWLKLNLATRFVSSEAFARLDCATCDWRE